MVMLRSCRPVKLMLTKTRKLVEQIQIHAEAQPLLSRYLEPGSRDPEINSKYVQDWFSQDEEHIAHRLLQTAMLE